MEYDKNEEENTLPKTAVDRAIQTFIPKNFVVPKDTREMFQTGCIEFLNIISIEASKICESEKRKTIGHEHLIKALEKLGFGAYIEECKAAHRDYEQYVKSKPSNVNKFKDSGLSLEELHNQQLELFKSAKMQFEKSFEDGNDCKGEE